MIGEDVGVGAATVLVLEAIGGGFWLPGTQPQVQLGAIFLYHIVCRMVNVCLPLVCRINVCVSIMFCYFVSQILSHVFT